MKNHLFDPDFMLDVSFGLALVSFGLSVICLLAVYTFLSRMVG